MTITETPGHTGDPDFRELLRGFDADGLDLILVEGFRHEPFPKIELHRPSLGRPLLYPEDPSIIAVACDAELEHAPPVPVLDLNRADAVTAFVVDYVRRFRNPRRDTARNQRRQEQRPHAPRQPPEMAPRHQPTASFNHDRNSCS